MTSGIRKKIPVFVIILVILNGVKAGNRPLYGQKTISSLSSTPPTLDEGIFYYSARTPEYGDPPLSPSSDYDYEGSNLGAGGSTSSYSSSTSSSSTSRRGSYAGFTSSNSGSGSSSDYDYDDSSSLAGLSVYGRPGDDFPIFASVPRTGFSCDGRLPGYYADTQTGCQAFYICQDGGRMDKFLCPNATLFNQQLLVCDYWFNVDCSQAGSFYSVNENLFVEPLRTGSGYGSRGGQSSSGYGGGGGGGGGQSGSGYSGDGQKYDAGTARSVGGRAKNYDASPGSGYVSRGAKGDKSYDSGSRTSSGSGKGGGGGGGGGYAGSGGGTLDATFGKGGYPQSPGVTVRSRSKDSLGFDRRSDRPSTTPGYSTPLDAGRPTSYGGSKGISKGGTRPSRRKSGIVRTSTPVYAASSTGGRRGSDSVTYTVEPNTEDDYFGDEANRK